jgi:polyphenol oxidase
LAKKQQLTFKIFKNYPLTYGLSLLGDGDMHLGFKDNEKNRAKFFKAKSVSNKKIIAADLVHGANIRKINGPDKDMVIRDTDALASSDEAVVLTITVADCFPIYFYNPKENIIALAHSGWRGTINNIAGKVIKAISKNPADVLAGIGPGIQACHFEIKQDIVGKFKLYPKAIINRKDKIFIDLPRIIKQQLADSGVRTIENSGECTYCEQDKYFSFRRDKPKQVEAMLAYIAKAS